MAGSAVTESKTTSAVWDENKESSAVNQSMLLEATVWILNDHPVRRLSDAEAANLDGGVHFQDLMLMLVYGDAVA